MCVLLTRTRKDFSGVGWNTEKSKIISDVPSCIRSPHQRRFHDEQESKKLKNLIDEGLVVQEGVKKHTRYRLHGVAL